MTRRKLNTRWRNAKKQNFCRTIRHRLTDWDKHLSSTDIAHKAVLLDTVR